MKPGNFHYVRPESLGEALELLAESKGSGRVIAGGQSLGPMLNLRLAFPETVLDICRLPELAAVEERDGVLSVGAAVRHADIEDGAVPDVANGLLQRTASGIAYRAVRNRGTIGGSLAHADPAADWPPVLMALDARVVLRSARGSRELAVRELIVGDLTTSLEPDEVIEKILIPRLPGSARWGHYKINAMPGHFADALAVVVRDSAAGAAAVVLSGRSLSPVRLSRTGELLAGARDWSQSLAEEVKRAVRTDLEEAGHPPLSQDDLALQQVSVVRASREVYAS